jgi:hypothetical protein
MWLVRSFEESGAFRRWISTSRHLVRKSSTEDMRVFQDRSIQLDLDTCFGLFSPTETLLPILSFIREW